MRIINCGDIEYQEQCHHCNYLFAFSQNEILTDTTGKFFGTNGLPLKFLLCPQCNRVIMIDKLKEL